ncbi:MAG: Na(+)/H(+) antiporter subunit D [Pseudomonadota bacterium]
MLDAVLAFGMTPVWPFIIGALLVAAVPSHMARRVVCVLVPLVALGLVFNAPNGSYATVSLAGLDLTMMRVDALSRLFALAFCAAGVMAAVYAWHLTKPSQQVATLLYSGAAVGAVLAGDFITLFIYWEITALASVFLIWGRITEGAFNTGMRYLGYQIGSGVLLIGGIALLYRETGSIDFGTVGTGSWSDWSIGVWLVFAALGIKAAFPFVHCWLKDAYPAATVSGTVVLSIFTTKMAIYCLIRGFSGAEILVIIGPVMALYPLIFAEVEDDLRRALSYTLISQLGIMVTGIGVGSGLAINGAAAHAVASIFYQGLLFMVVGAVLYRTGTAQASALGGLWRTMPVTAILCLVGSASIASVPLFSGFVSKSMTVDATAQSPHFWAWSAIVLASVGAFINAGIKVPYRLFFGTDSGHPSTQKGPAEAPHWMIVAMVMAALACLALGLLPGAFYAALPVAADYKAYTVSHFISQGQLLIPVFLVWWFMNRAGLWVTTRPGTVLDVDWIFRRFLTAVLYFIDRFFTATFSELKRGWAWLISLLAQSLAALYGPEGPAARLQPTGTMVLWLAILLGVALGLNLIDRA